MLEEVRGGASGGLHGNQHDTGKGEETILLGSLSGRCKKTGAQSAVTNGLSTWTKGEMKQYNVGASLKWIAINVVGQHPTTTNNNKYTLVAMD